VTLEHDDDSRPAAARGLALPTSVVIPAHNRATTVARAVTSALAQTTPAAEVLVVDDGSDDNTTNAAREAGARVLQHEGTRGAGAARNTGVSAATQPWIAFLDSDDEWLPHHLSAVWSLRADHVLVAGSGLARMNNGMQRHLGPPESNGRMLGSPLDVATTSIIVTSAVLARRDAIEEAGGFSEEVEPKPQVEDFDLWLRLLERGTGYVSPQVSVVYHEQAGAGPVAGPGLQIARRRVLESYTDRPWFRAEVLDAWQGIMSWDAARAAQRSGDYSAAARHLAAISRSRAGVAAVLTELKVRYRARRRSTRVGASGQPTLALVDGGLAQDSVPGGFAVVVPSGSTKAARYVSLARRPAAAVVAARRSERLLVRALGMQPITPQSVRSRGD
jgi:hypothetical protein